MTANALRGSLFLLKIALLVIAAIFIAQHPGEASISWFGYRVEMNTGVFLALALLAFALFTTITNLWRAIWRLPVILTERRQKRSERKSLVAMVDGITAIAAGEVTEARRQSKRAESYNPTHPMNIILGAQAAFTSGKMDEAKTRFLSMTRASNTAFLGYRGLSLLSKQTRDWENLRNYLHNALALRPNSPWVLQQLMDLDLRLGYYDKAAMIVEQMQLRQLINKHESRRYHALIHWMQAERARSEGNMEGFIQTATSAHQEAPEVSAIAVELAKYYISIGRESKAIKSLTYSFAAAPHTDLGLCLMTIRSDAQPIDRYREMEALTTASPDNPESLYLLAKSALEAKLWGQARKHADELKNAQNSQRACRLMAEIEESEHPYTPEKAHIWWEKASEAPADPTWVCHSCHTTHNRWTPICPACGQFDQLEWGLPSQAHATLLPENLSAARLAV